MKSAITKAQIRWLTDVDIEPSYYEPREEFTHMDIPMKEDEGNGTIDILSLNLAMDISRGFHHFTPKMRGQLFPFAEVRSELSEPLLVVQSAMTGRVVLREMRLDKELIFYPGNDLFHHVDYLHFTPQLDTNEDITVTLLKLGESILATILGDELAQQLIAGLGLKNTPSACVTPVPLHISEILHSSMSDQLQGDLRKIHAQAKILDYLCALTQHVSQITLTHDTHNQRQVKLLHKELIHKEGKIPSLDELAKEYGMSVKTLNDNFKALFGKTINRFITEHRMKQAHEAINSSDVAMKILASKLGYSHVNHFINAFKKQFGYPPGSLRK